MATTEQFSLRWNNFHSNLTSGFHDLLQANDMVDVTLAADGQFLQAHKVILSICSPFFKSMFKINPCRHPIIILKDVTYTNLKDILEFMYLGEVNVLRDNLTNFLRTAELLQVKGLTGDDSDEKLDGESDTDQDIQQFNQMIESSLESSIQQLPEMSSPTSTSQLKRLVKIPTTNDNVKKLKTDINISDKKCKELDNDKFDLLAKQNIDEFEFLEASHPKTDSYVSESENMQNKEIIKHLLESNSVHLSEQDSSQDQDLWLYSPGDAKKHVFCPYCCRKFVNRYNLKVHIQDKHDSNSTNLDCVICGKTMRNKSCLRVHLYHHRKQELLLAQQKEQAGAALIE